MDIIDDIKGQVEAATDIKGHDIKGQVLKFAQNTSPDPTLRFLMPLRRRHIIDPFIEGLYLNVLPDIGLIKWIIVVELFNQFETLGLNQKKASCHCLVIHLIDQRPR